MQFSFRTNNSSRITISIIVSFVARGLSSIRSQIFCYTAISSSGIIGILPGYLIREVLSFGMNWDFVDIFRLA